MFTERGKPLKEAAPFTVELVKAMKIFVVDSAFEAAKVFLWWVPCMIFASLRFDDAVHVKPLNPQVTQDGIFGGKQTLKRKKRGTKFLVPGVGCFDRRSLTAGVEGNGRTRRGRERKDQKGE